MLEVIDKGRCTDEHPTPLLFIHGAWHAAWRWDEHFLDYFATRGYRAVAVSLRGHGGSTARKSLRWIGIQDYVDDIAAAAGQLPRPPVVIGHSMGGFAVQHYLERHTPAGAVLVAAMPPSGVLGVTMRIARGYPREFVKVNTALRLGPLVEKPQLVKDLFFSPGMPDALVNSYYERVQDESYRVFLDMLVLELVRTKRVNRVPMLVLGAERDAIVTPREIRRTAAVYGAPVQIFEGMAHDMMLEPGWSVVAERIDGWLTAGGL